MRKVKSETKILSSPFSADEQVISEEMANKLRKLKDDDDVKSRSLSCVNSPGGSAYISGTDMERSGRAESQEADRCFDG